MRRFLILTIVFGLVGLIVGIWIPSAPGRITRALDIEPEQRLTYLPEPYQVSARPGGVSLRVAMIHDVLHQRYPTHGDDYNEEVVQRASEATRANHDKPIADWTAADFDHYDDLGVALDRLHRSDEAAAAMANKITRLVERAWLETADWPARATLPDYDTVWSYQPDAMPDEQRAAYRTWANLGTFLIHGNFGAALGGDAAARERLTSGLAMIETAIHLNPGAHFGRETWQALVVRFMLEALDDPLMLTRQSLIGIPLEPVLEYDNDGRVWMNAATAPHRGGYITDDSQIDSDSRRAMRAGIVPVYQTREWIEAVTTDHVAESAMIGVNPPFDEPALACMGMWMLGGGPNPHFALALAQLALLIGQPRVAWAGFARAHAMRERFSAREDVRAALVSHVLSEMDRIERILGESHEVLHKQHAAELAFGEAYQAERHRFEAAQIAAGADIDNPSFYAGFERDDTIASPVGKADLRAIEDRSGRYRPADAPPRRRIVAETVFGFTLMGAGLGGWLALLLALVIKPKRRPPAADRYGHPAGYPATPPWGPMQPGAPPPGYGPPHGPPPGFGPPSGFGPPPGPPGSAPPPDPSAGSSQPPVE